MAKYLLRLTNEFSSVSGAQSRSRAGVTVPVGEGVETDLSKDQLAEVHADRYIEVRDAKTRELVAAQKSEEVIPHTTEAENAQQAEDAPSTEELKAEVEKGLGTSEEASAKSRAKKA